MLIILISISLITVISTIISRNYIIANANDLSYTIDEMPPTVSSTSHNEVTLYRISVIFKFILLNIVSTVAVIVVLYKVKIFQKGLVDLLLSILIVIIPNILLYINTSELLYSLIHVVY